jgi:exopolyphosphatase/pppGpp-phosphohydrolase
MPLRKSDPLLAVVDLGSNSFRLEIGRVEGSTTRAA